MKPLKPKLILNYLAAFSNLVDYWFLFEFSSDHRRDYVTMNCGINNARKAYSTAATENYIIVDQEMRAKVPTRSLICRRLKSIFKLLVENITESKLTYEVQHSKIFLCFIFA